MDKRGIMVAWLHHERRGLLLAFVLTAVFAAVAFLYGLPAEAVGYGAVLMLFVTLAIEGAGYVGYRRRLLELERMRTCLQDDLPALPVPGDRMEEAYQQLLCLLCADRAQRTAREENRRRETMDYYTLWAHQVKTPIAAMRLLLQSPEKLSVPELEAELMQVEQYVGMVLSYLRLDSESSDFVFTRQPLEPIVRSAVRKLAKLFILKKITLDLQPLPLQVLTDSKWLGFVLEQLLTNALKYTPEKGRVTLRQEENRLILSDTGIGIHPEDLPRVFEKGFTGYNGRQQQRATGLGLYLCRSVMEKLGHGLKLESSPGKGTTAILCFSTKRPTYE